MKARTKNRIVAILISKGFDQEGIFSVVETLSGLGKRQLRIALQKIREKENKFVPGAGYTWDVWYRGEDDPFHGILDINDPRRYWVNTGGRGSGKSHDIQEVIVKMTFEKSNGILFARYLAKSVETSIAPGFLAAAKRLGLEQYFEITKSKVVNKLTGSFIYMASLFQNGSSSSGMKGLDSINVAFLDEAEDLDSSKAWELYNKMNKSIRRKDKVNRVCLTLNPRNKKGQVYANFIKESKGIQLYKSPSGKEYPVEVSTRKDVAHIHSTFMRIQEYLDDGWLIEEQRQRMRAETGKDPDNGRKLTEEERKMAIDAYENEFMGIFNSHIVGRVFPYFEVEKVFPDHIPAIYGMDFGYAHVDALMKVGIDYKNMKIYIEQIVFENGLSEGDLGKRIIRSVPRNATIVADSAEPRLINDLRRITNRSIVAVKKQMVGYQIKQIQDFTIVICGKSDGTVAEFETYRWSENVDSKGHRVPNKKDDVDNSIDASRYALTLLMKDYEKVGKAMQIPKQNEESSKRTDTQKREMRDSKLAQMRKRRGLI